MRPLPLRVWKERRTVTSASRSAGFWSHTGKYCWMRASSSRASSMKELPGVGTQNPAERDALVTVRRSFTLKGSGRRVGARDLGEFAWSIENLVNRVLDNALTRSPAILETLRAAVAALPQLGRSWTAARP